MARVFSTLRWALAISLSVAGCSENQPQHERSGPDWNTDVGPIIATKCASCHSEGGVGGFALETYSQTSAIADAVADAVVNERMPPWGADGACNEYLYDISLTEAEKQTISDWANSGAPRGSGPIATAMPLESGPSNHRADVSISGPAEYTPTGLPDDYRCFPMDWPLEEPAYVTGYEVVPGQLSLVHHVIAYIVPGHYRGDIDRKVQEDGQPGYSCFGGPGVVEQRDAEWLGGWAPGGAARSFPEGTGIAMDPGDIIVLQVHYHTEGREVLADRTRIDLTVEDWVESEAWIQPFANPFWLYEDQMDIPSGSEGHEESFSFSFDEGTTVFSANVHMHLLGKQAQLSIQHEDGSESCLLNVPEYDFEWQRTYRFKEKQVLKASDRIKLSCFFDNPTDEAVNWGDGTTDEMCLATMYMTE